MREIMGVEFDQDMIRKLAKLERQMDDGEIPFVVVGGNRASVPDDVMDDLELQSGQSVSDLIYIGILEEILRRLNQKIDEQAIEEFEIVERGDEDDQDE